MKQSKVAGVYMRLSKTVKVIKENTQLKVGCIMLIILLLSALLAPIIAPHNPNILSDDMVVAPGMKYLLGTDGLGRDILSMILYGARTSLIVGFTAAMIAGIIGTLLGGFAGYFGGWIDGVIGEMINIFMMMPTFFLILIVVALFGSGLFNVMVVIGLTTWVGNAKLMRAQAMSLRQRTFIKSAESIGESRISILFKHIIPNGIFPIIANTTMGVAGAILTESSLAFLGLGDPNVISWGQIIQNGKSYLVDGWWMCVFAGLAIIFTVVTFYLIGDGLNRVLSPKLRNLGKEGRG
jgi:peptide/nickel transport system permease protein